jgi:catechol 2,3-dioxygenase-like lactoylglutathione lyase family enzyme
MPIRGFDHVALPTRDPEALIAFYRRLGFPIIYEQEWRSGELPIFAIQVGPDAKINVHPPEMWQDPSFEARGPTALPGCGDLCFVFDGSIDDAVKLIRDAGAEISYGPFDQKGGGLAGQREGTSVYTRDPDGNLIEFMTYPAAGRGGWQPEDASGS